MSSDKFLITHTLLSSWEWLFKLDGGYDDFIRTLRREPMTSVSQAILDGRQFESMVSAYNAGNPLDTTHKWYDGIVDTASLLKGSAEQVKLSRNVVVDSIEFVLYGVLDNLRAGVIFDTKMSKTYSYGKYRDSTQHPMYFALCPEAYKFDYVVYNGKDVYVEEYRADDTAPIEPTISHFISWLYNHDLMSVYTEKWRSKY